MGWKMRFVRNWGRLGMKYNLSDICEFVKGKTEVSTLDGSSYISTENMLPNRGGVCKATNLPALEQTQSYCRNDTLVSNIRPYFKKIWQACKDGGCSSDVLVFRAKKGISPDFLYYVLADDMFFEYAMATSKGTKMPRGDKTAIMQYSVPDFDYDTQCKIASILKCLDHRIVHNSAINENLEEQAQAIFDHMFPNIGSGENNIGDCIIPKRGKSLLSKDAVSGEVPVVAGGLEPATYHNVSNTIEPVLVISASGANAGYVSLWNIPVWSSDSSYIDSSMTDDVYFWYVLLKKRQREIFDAQTGSAQPHIYPQHIAAMSMLKLESAEITQYTTLITPLFKTIGHNKAENIRLIALRNSLLPKLMSGELVVPDIEF